jgi:hypothetical protein
LGQELFSKRIIQVAQSSDPHSLLYARLRALASFSCWRGRSTAGHDRGNRGRAGQERAVPVDHYHSGRQHGRFGVSPSHFVAFGDALIWSLELLRARRSVAEFLGNACSSEIRS